MVLGKHDIINRIILHSLLLDTENFIIQFNFLYIWRRGVLLTSAYILYFCIFETLDYCQIGKLRNSKRSTATPLIDYQPAFKHVDDYKLLIYTFWVLMC